MPVIYTNPWPPNLRLCGCGRLPNDCGDVLPQHRTRASAEHWQAIAENEESSVRDGSALCPDAAKHRADGYRAVARALFLEAETGKPHCALCFQPVGSCKRGPLSTCRPTSTTRR